jgi:putative DNA primase/helicase
MTRRSIRIRIDAEVEHPEQRHDFRHPDLLGWARANRGELVWAALTLARAWVAAGRPAGPERPLGAFESWTRVIGGILAVAGIPGLLENAAELRAASTDTTARDFIAAVHAEHGEAEFTSAAVVNLAREHLALGSVADAQAAQRVGARLREMADRPMGGLVLRRSTAPHGSRLWQVHPVRSRTTPTTPPPPRPAVGTVGVVGMKRHRTTTT